MTPPIPTILCFDVEPDDIEVPTGAPPWAGFERLVERADAWRERLTIATRRPVRFSWFLRMDPQIAEAYGTPGWVVDRYGGQLDRLRAAGDVIGLHPHALRLTATPGRWVADHADAEWVDQCVDMAYEAYRVAFGEPCRAQRFGDRFISARALRRAVELGARYDLSVEPGARRLASLHPGMAATGRSPDMRDAPREPYRPSRDDPIRPDVTGSEHPGRADTTTAPWMIPLTSVDPHPMLPAWRRAARRVRHPGGPWHRPATLAAPWPADGFWGVIERELDAMARPYLAFAVRSDVSVKPAQIGPIEEKIARLQTLPIAERLEFTTPDAVVPA
ncbi:MAG: hypothetical protein ACJ779_06570 [Chloroflexota bacterium]